MVLRVSLGDGLVGPHPAPPKKERNIRISLPIFSMVGVQDEISEKKHGSPFLGVNQSLIFKGCVCMCVCGIILVDYDHFDHISTM